MWFDYALTRHPVACPAVAVRTVYVLHADRSYDVKRSGAPAGTRYALFRTIAGHGEIVLAQCRPEPDELRGLRHADGADGAAVVVGATPAAPPATAVAGATAVAAATGATAATAATAVADCVIAVGADSVILTDFRSVWRYRCIGAAWRFCWFDVEFAGAPPFPLNEAIALPGGIAAGIQDEQAALECLSLLQRNEPAAARCASAIVGRLSAQWALAAASGTTAIETSGVRPPATPAVVSRARSATRAPTRPAAQQVIQGVLHRVVAAIHEPWPAERMAAVAGLSPRRFREVFGQVMGVGPKAFTLRLRLDHARELLRTQGLSVAAAASRTGFSSPFHLSKAFARHFGHPPSHDRA